MKKNFIVILGFTFLYVFLINCHNKTTFPVIRTSKEKTGYESKITKVLIADFNQIIDQILEKNLNHEQILKEAMKTFKQTVPQLDKQTEEMLIRSGRKHIVEKIKDL